MKITKSTLAQLIKEEIDAVLNEEPTLDEIIDEEIEETYREMRLRQGARMIDEYGMEEEYVGESSMEEGFLEEEFFFEEDMEENPDLQARIKRLEDALLG